MLIWLRFYQHIALIFLLIGLIFSAIGSLLRGGSREDVIRRQSQMVSRIPGAQKFVMSNARAYDSTKDSKTDECVICFENFSDSDNK